MPLPLSMPLLPRRDRADGPHGPPRAQRPNGGHRSDGRNGAGRCDRPRRTHGTDRTNCPVNICTTRKMP